MYKTVMVEGRMVYVKFNQEQLGGSVLTEITKNSSTEELTLKLQLNTSPTTIDDIIHGIEQSLPTIAVALVQLGYSAVIPTGER